MALKMQHFSGLRSRVFGRIATVKIFNNRLTMRPIEPMLNHRLSSRSSSLIRRFFLMAFCCSCGATAFGQGVSVLTFHYDFSRTGQNTNETILTPANVNTNTFGQLFSYVVDGDVYAEPLYVPGLVIPGQGTHNVVFVATQYNNIYAFDADSNQGSAKGLLWNVNLGPYAATPNNDFGNRYGPYHDIDPSVGITGTPGHRPRFRNILCGFIHP